MTDWQHVKAIGRTELRRRWRSLQGNPAQLVALLFAGLFGLLAVGVLLFGAFIFGTGIRTGDLDAPIDLVRQGVIYTWIFVLGFGGYRAYATALRPDRLDGMLTTVSHRELLGGLLFAEALVWGIPGAVLVGLCVLLFAAGSGSIVAAPVAFVTIGLVVATALTGGFLVALVIRNTGVRSKLLTRLRTVFVVVLGVGYFWLLVTQSFDTVLAPVYWVLSSTPIGWFGDLLLIGTVTEASVVRAAGAVVGSGLFFVVSARFLTRLAALLWYADGVYIQHQRTDSVSPTASRFESILSRPIAGIVLRDWQRTRRAPITLSFAIYPIIVLVNPTMTAIQTGSISRSFPILAVLSGAWITGALFSLNVLGNEGAVLPATLLANNLGQRLVVGHSVAGALIGVPLTAGATVTLGIASPHSPMSVITLTASALVLTLCTGAIASGVGVVFPRFEEVSVSRSRKAIVPSTLAFVVYSIVLILVALPTIIGHSVTVGHAIDSWLGVPQPTLRLAGTALSGTLGVGFGAVSAAYAVRSVDGFRFD